MGGPSRFHTLIATHGALDARRQALAGLSNFVFFKNRFQLFDFCLIHVPDIFPHQQLPRLAAA